MREVWRAMQANPHLRGRYAPRDSRFVTQARDLPSHRGYQDWHRRLDDEVVGWLGRNQTATPQQFESYLRGLYQQPDLAQSFSNELPRDSMS